LIADRRPVRLFVADDLAAGASVALDADQAHYLRNVMRRCVGDPVYLFNGRDGEWRSTLAEIGKRRALATAGERVRGQPPASGPWLVFAPVKGGRVEDIVEKATELGAARILPAITERTVVPRVNVGRLQARAVEAAEQCDRLDVPDIAEARPLDAVLADWPAGRRLMWCDESGGGAPIADALAGAEKGPWAVMTGPEGGYAPAELDAVRKLPFVTAVGLGERILRADTAAVAALACLQAIAGDWRSGHVVPGDSNQQPK
jgi:16S rRNA (uracil1498-N3)-methyltransferase